jgi:hypothetical protein
MKHVNTRWILEFRFLSSISFHSWLKTFPRVLRTVGARLALAQVYLFVSYVCFVVKRMSKIITRPLAKARLYNKLGANRQLLGFRLQANETERGEHDAEETNHNVHNYCHNFPLTFLAVTCLDIRTLYLLERYDYILYDFGARKVPY